MNQGKLERWVTLLSGGRLAQLNGVPDYVGGGTDMDEERPIIQAWLNKEELPSKEELLNRLQKYATQLSSKKSDSSLAWAAGETVFLAGLLLRAYSVDNAEYFHYAVPAGVKARASFGNWEAYYNAYLEGAAAVLTEDRYEALYQEVKTLLLPTSILTQYPWEMFPDILPSLPTMSVRCAQLCPHCHNWMTLSYLGGKQQCSNCLGVCDSRSPEQILPEILTEVRHQVPGMLGESYRSTTDTTVERVYAQTVIPECFSCQVPLDISVLTKNPTPKKIRCASCNKDYRVRELSSEHEDSLLGVKWTIGEVEGRAEVKQSGQNFALSCQHCGTLIRPGTQRTITCAQCNGKTDIPDSVWQIIHPPVKSTGIYVVALR